MGKDQNIKEDMAEARLEILNWNRFPLGSSQPVREWRAVEDAVRAMQSPTLKLVKDQLVAVLQVNYDVLDGEVDDLDC